MTEPNDSLQLLEALVQRPSVTPDDQGCQRLIGERLEASGFTLEHMRFDDVDNLWARLGDEGPVFAFAGHTDVVPTGNEADWTYPPFAARVDNGMLYGRGAADMKGGVAAMVCACERFVAAHPTFKGSLAFLLTSDEEGPALNGTAKVMQALQARGEHIDWCVLGEPTSTDRLGDVIKNGRRGSLGARLTVRGTQGHVAYPHLADNPVHNLAPFLSDLIGIEWDTGDEFFPATTLQISNIQAGTGATNVIPGSAVVDFNLRYGTASTSDGIKTRTTELCKLHGLDCTIEWRDSAAPFLTTRGALTEAVCQSILDATGQLPTLATSGGTSDGRFIAPTGTQLVEFGPINATIHQIDERVNCDDIVTLSRLYEAILKHMLLQSDSTISQKEP